MCVVCEFQKKTTNKTDQNQTFGKKCVFITSATVYC